MARGRSRRAPQRLDVVVGALGEDGAVRLLPTIDHDDAVFVSLPDEEQPVQRLVLPVAGLMYEVEIALHQHVTVAREPLVRSGVPDGLDNVEERETHVQVEAHQPLEGRHAPRAFRLHDEPLSLPERHHFEMYGDVRRTRAA